MNIKTPLTREFEKDLTQRMSEFKNQVDFFRECFDEKKHYISAEYYIYTPPSSLFTQEGKISRRSCDIDCHKTFQDVICKFILVDDVYIRKAYYSSLESHNDKWNFVVIYKLELLCNLKNTYSSTQALITQTNKNLMDQALL